MNRDFLRGAALSVTTGFARRQLGAPAGGTIAEPGASTGLDIAAAFWIEHRSQRRRGMGHVPSAKLFFPEERPAFIVEESLALWSRP